MRYFEELSPGDSFDCGQETVERAEMVAFAERYDPQPFHVDEDAAAATPFGGLVASGWYTAAVCMRRLVAGALSEIAATGARGVDELRWNEPVRPGDTLRARATVAETVPESERHGLVRLRVTGTKVDRGGSSGGDDADESGGGSDGADGEPAISMVGLVLVSRRDGETVES